MSHLNGTINLLFKYAASTTILLDKNILLMHKYVALLVSICQIILMFGQLQPFFCLKIRDVLLGIILEKNFGQQIILAQKYKFDNFYYPST